MPEHELLGISLGEAGLHLHLARELDVADAERNERFAARSCVRRRWRREVLRRPRPEPAAPREELLRHVGARTARARALRGERDDPARGASAPDQLRIVARPGEHAFRDRHSRHQLLISLRSSSLTTLPVAFTGSASRNSTVRGTLKFAISRACPFDDLRRVDGRARREHDERLADFTEPLVGHADDGDLRDARVAQHEVLDLGRVRVEPTDDEHVLDAADDAQVAVGVERAEVAGVQPTVGVDRSRGRVRVVEIAAHHGLASHDRPRPARPARCRYPLGRRCAPRTPPRARRRSWRCARSRRRAGCR